MIIRSLYLDRLDRQRSSRNLTLRLNISQGKTTLLTDHHDGQTILKALKWEKESR